MTKTYDVIIVGAGLVGSSLARALHQLKFKVLVLDEQAPPAVADDKVLALNLNSSQYLQSLLPTNKLQFHPIRTVLVTEAKALNQVVLRASDEGLQALGYAVSNQYLVEQLQAELPFDRLGPVSNVQFDWQAKQVLCSSHLPSRKLRCKAPLVLACDGSRSNARRSQCINLKTENLNVQAISCNVVFSRKHDGMAHQRFIGNVSHALIPYAESQMKSVVMGPLDEILHLQSLGDQAYMDYLHQIFASRHGRCRQLSARHSYPLKHQRANAQVGHRLVLLGNAAHTLYPLAAQGFNLALRDVQSLAQHLQAQRALKQDLGEPHLLDWAEQRRSDHNCTDFLTLGLKRLFQSKGPGLATARSLGLGLFDSLPALKRALVERATWSITQGGT